MNTLAQPTTAAGPAATAYPAGYGMEERAKYGVYDKPADRRLAPWITAGSLLLGSYGALLIIFTFVKQGTLGSLWGLFVAGIILASVAIIGLLAGLTRRSQLAGLFFWALLGGFAASLVVMIINGARLDTYMNNRCASSGFARETVGCANLRQYHYITYTALGAFLGTVVPALLIASAYFWRITRLYRKEPIEGARHDSYGNRYPIGNAAL